MQWPGMVGAAGGLVLGFAFLRRRSALGIAATVLALGAFALLGVGGLAIIARYTMLAGGAAGDLRRPGLLGWRLLEPGHPWRRRWQAFAGLVALMFVIWGPNQCDLAAPGPHRPHQPGADRGRPHTTSPTPAPSSRSAARSRCPTTAPSPASPSTSKSSRAGSSAPARQRQPRRGYFLDPASPFVDPQLRPRPQRPGPALDPGPAGLPPGGPQRLLGALPPLLSLGSALSPSRCRAF